MKIHSICVVKNEGDIIELCIRKSLEWSDYVYIYDGESTDGTWEKATALQSERVIPWKKDGKVFQESLRAEVFNAFKSNAKQGDWWCHLDADEFYVQNPRDFLAIIPKSYHVVWGAMIEYYLTKADVDHIDFSASLEGILANVTRYAAHNSEPRFFRHRERLRWPTTVGWPHHMGISFPERILLKHYKYRSPNQIQLRLDTRRANRARGFPGWEHAKEDRWEKMITDSEGLHVDRGDGKYIIDWKAMPDHLGSRSSRLVKKIMHGLGIWP